MSDEILVYGAISAVQGALAKEGISKTRKNQQQGYSFRGIDDVYNALSGLLAEHRLCIIPRYLSRVVTERESKQGGALFNVVVEAEFDLVGPDGSRHTARNYGEAMDSADKATNKAMSAAYKNMALQVFAIPTEGDNDADAATHEVRAEQKKAQAEYLSGRGLEPYVAPRGRAAVQPATSPETIRELSDTMDQPANTIEMRQTAKTAEAEAVLKDAEKDASKKKGRSGAHGVVSLDKLELWKKMKADLRAYTGNDDLYKAILQSKSNTEHANEIQTKEQATAAWNALKAELTRLGVEANKKKQDGQLAELLAHSSEVIGSRAFIDLLGAHSCTSVTDVLGLAADPLEWLLRDLKGLVDERQTK